MNALTHLADALRRNRPELRPGLEGALQDGYCGHWVNLPPATIQLKSRDLRIVFHITGGGK